MITKAHPDWQEFKLLALVKPMNRAIEALISPALSPEQTATLRGEIAAYRQIILAIEGPPNDANGGFTYADGFQR
jgi:hypothetical protein